LSTYSSAASRLWDLKKLVKYLLNGNMFLKAGDMLIRMLKVGMIEVCWRFKKPNGQRHYS